MQTVKTVKEVRELVVTWRMQGASIAFVPTMGNLHAGHIKLVTEARKTADKVVVSIFVNPTQFGVGEDFESYPRTERDDEKKLLAANVDLLFLPMVIDMYPEGASAVVSVPEISTRHCGASRPGHFDGVTTVVAKLFNMVQPHQAFFGEKDYQQLAILTKMVRDLNFPLDIIGVETQRESDGLAMSSRNGFLTEKQRQTAPELYRSLCAARKKVCQGEGDFRVIEKQQKELLEGIGFKVDYFSICNSENLQLAVGNETELTILVAAKLGKPRLIDNVYFSTNKT